MALFISILANPLAAQTLVHYWNFNNSASEAEQLTRFAQGLGGLVGNNRFDNFTLEGIGADLVAPTVVFQPLPQHHRMAPRQRQRRR